MQQEEITNPYELQRQQIIARNRARLLALGIPQAVEGLSKLAAAAAKKPRAPRPKRPAEPQEPSRQSSRLRDRELIARGEVPPDVEEGSELAMFIIDGECPRCGKVLSVGHTRHLEVCKGPPEPPTEEEIAAQAEVYRAQQKDKLQQLELGGLVDYYTPQAATAAAGGAAAALGQQQGAVETGTAQQQQQQQQQQQEAQEEEQQKPKQKARGKKKAAGKGGKQAAAAAAAGPGVDEPYAIFIVIGSRGDHYTIKLTDERRSCQCLDHRFRRHDCKHIRLILEQLGVSDNPTAWQEALSEKLGALGAADEDDVQRVKEAEERAQARRQKAAEKEAAAVQEDVGDGGDEVQEDSAAAAAGATAGRGKARGKRGKAAGRKRKAGS